MSKSSDEIRVLRILSGPHAGAEMSLRPGRYVIGTGDSCDIVLRDPDLAARHALLSIEEDGEASVEPLQGTIGGGETSSQPETVPDFQPIVLGATGFAVGPTGATWPKIDLPKQSGETPANGSSAETPPARPEAGEPSTSAFAGSGGASDATAGKGQRIAGLPLRGVVIGACLALLIVVIATLDLSWSGSDATGDAANTAAETPQTLKEQAEAVITQLDLGDALQVTESTTSSRQQLQVSGYVPTEQDRRALLQALQPWRNQIGIQVWSSELLRGSIRQALAGLRAPLTITKMDGGDIVLTGVVDGTTSADEIKTDLLRDVPGITNLDLQIVNRDDAIAWLRSQLAVAGIQAQSLTIDGSGGRVFVSGTMDSGFADAWQKTVQAFDTRYTSFLDLDDRVTLATTTAPERETLARLEATESTAAAGGRVGTDGFDFVVRAISTGPPAFVTLGSDEKYLVGSRFPNGMILDRIDASGIVLSDEGTRHLVRIAPETGKVTDVQVLAAE